MMSPRDHLKFADDLTTLMDRKYSLLGVSFGLDPIFNLIPGFGNIVSAGLSLYLLWIAITLKVESTILVRMIVNVVIDYFLGSIPIIGLVFDILFKANVRNLDLLKHVTKKKRNVEEGEILE